MRLVDDYVAGARSVAPFHLQIIRALAATSLPSIPHVLDGRQPIFVRSRPGTVECRFQEQLDSDYGRYEDFHTGLGLLGRTSIWSQAFGRPPPLLHPPERKLSFPPSNRHLVLAQNGPPTTRQRRARLRGRHDGGLDQVPRVGGQLMGACRSRVFSTA